MTTTLRCRAVLPIVIGLVVWLLRCPVALAQCQPPAIIVEISANTQPDATHEWTRLPPSPDEFAWARLEGSIPAELDGFGILRRHAGSQHRADAAMLSVRLETSTNR